MLYWMLSLPGSGKSLGHVAPVVRTTASYSSLNSLADISLPTLTFVLKSMPSAASRSTLLCTTPLLSFIVGIPYWSRPPMRSFRSKTVTKWPTLFNWLAQAKPAGPEPTMATFVPVLNGGICAVIHLKRYLYNHGISL